MRRNYFNIEDYRMNNRSSMMESRRRALREGRNTDIEYFQPRTLKELYQWVQEQNDKGVKVLDVSGIDVSGLTDLSFCFDCTNFREIKGLENWDVSNVENMFDMFAKCQSLKTLDLSNWDVSNVRNMEDMFFGCQNLKTLDLSNWNVSNVTNMQWMFGGCKKLTEIKGIEDWDVSNVKDKRDMFYRCDNLKTTHNSDLDSQL